MPAERKRKEKQRLFASIRKLSARKEGIRWRKYSEAVAAVLLIGLFVSLASREWHRMRMEQKSARTERIDSGEKAELILENGERVCLNPTKDLAVYLQASGIRHDSLNGLDYLDVSVFAEDSSLEYNTMRIPVGGFYRLRLADGTRVWLNSLTSLRYPVAFPSDERKVYLDGEAYFEVAADVERPFIVATDEGVDVRVYGTEFNVDTHQEGWVKTTLVKGDVGIRIKDSEREVKLSPRQMALFSSETQAVRVEDVDPYGAIAWKDGKFVFEEETVENIMERLRRWYDVEVFYTSEKVKNHTFTGIITRFDDIADVLYFIEETAVVKFDIRGNVITVK